MNSTTTPTDLGERIAPLLPFLGQLPAAVAILRAKDRACVFTNAAFDALHGTTRASDDGIDRPLRRSELLQWADEVMTTGRTFVARELRAQGLRATGTSAPALLDVVIEPVRDETGAVLGVVLYAREIEHPAALAVERSTLLQRERAARRIAEANARRIARLQTVTAALGEVLTLNELGEVIIANVVEAFGANAAWLLLHDDESGGNELELVSGFGIADAERDQLARMSIDAALPGAVCYAAGEELFVESAEEYASRFPRRANEIIGALACVPVRQRGHVVGAIGMEFRDARRFSAADRSFLHSLSDLCGQALHRAALYDAERRAKDEALAASRLKDEFLATLSHELRTPLQSILGWARLLGGGLDGATVPRAIESIDRNARAQARLIADILDVSRIITGRLCIQSRVAHIETFVRGALDTLRPAAEAKGIRLDALFDARSETIVGDPDRLQQVVWNLVANAVKFTPDGGHVRVAVTSGDGSVILRVSDTGIGIAKDFLPFVFDRFRQANAATTRAHGGLGLGLAIVRHLVELHGGTVSANSEGAGTGSTFTVELPVRAVIPAPADGGESPSTMDVTELDRDAISLDGVHVLVVDDHADARDLVATALERFGARVVTAGSAHEALGRLRNDRPDVLVSDVGMPEVDGCELLRLIRSLGEPLASIPALALTAYARDVERIRALDAGFQVYLSKPVDPRALARSVATLDAASRERSWAQEA